MIGNRLSLQRRVRFFLLCLLVVGGFQSCSIWYEQELEGPLTRYNDRILPATGDPGEQVIKAWDILEKCGILACPFSFEIRRKRNEDQN